MAKTTSAMLLVTKKDGTVIRFPESEVESITIERTITDVGNLTEVGWPPLLNSSRH